MKQWFSDMQKEVHILEPLPAGYGTETQDSEKGASINIETFLGEMLEKLESVFLHKIIPIFVSSN
jgi:hypothetical protein